MKLPQPPDGVYPVGNRLLGPIPSVPELQSYRDRLLAYTFLRGLEGLDDGWYSIMRELERSEQALDDARWRLACASWRSCRWEEMFRGSRREQAIWAGITLCMVWRWTGVFDEPTKVLALRRTAEVIQ